MGGAGAAKGLAKKGPQDEIEDRLREEVAIRKKEQQRHAEMLAKEEEDQQKLEALHKQLRGKEFGYDHKGQVRAAPILIAPGCADCGHTILHVCQECMSWLQ